MHQRTLTSVYIRKWEELGSPAGGSYRSKFIQRANPNYLEILIFPMYMDESGLGQRRRQGNLSVRSYIQGNDERVKRDEYMKWAEGSSFAGGRSIGSELVPIRLVKLISIVDWRISFALSLFHHANNILKLSFLYVFFFLSPDHFCQSTHTKWAGNPLPLPLFLYY